MHDHPSATWLLEQETRALLTRLALVQPFVLQETYLAAAALSPAALSGIEQYLIAGRRDVHQRARAFLCWLGGPGASAPAAEQQRRFWMLRLSFQNALAQLDLFSEVITQRSEHDNGVLLSGLDVAAAEALLVPGGFFEGPPVVCSLHRGLGGAIRRARTRLPGGGDNPVALIRIPRERMIGYGIASSLVHEVGHQGAALLRLVESLRAQLRPIRLRTGLRRAWDLWDRWISEIVADFWSISHIGIGSTLGLIGLVSLPRGFVFRASHDDPHPMPWVRVLLSCAIGDRLYPDPQWGRLAATWQAMYPTGGVRPQLMALISELRTTIPDLVSLIVGHRPARLRGRTLGEALRNPDLRRDALLRRFSLWETDPSRMTLTPPTVAFAVLGQARASGRLSPERESRMLRRLIASWAVRSSLETARAATRSDTPMFVGPPSGPTHPTRSARQRSKLTGGTTMSSTSVNGPAGYPQIVVEAQPERIAASGIVLLTAETQAQGMFTVEWTVRGPVPLSAQDTRIALLGATTVTAGVLTLGAGGNRILATLDTSPLAAGSWRVAIRLTRVFTDEAGDSDAERDDHDDGNVYEGESPPIEVTPRPFAAGDDVAVTLKRTAVPPTPDQALWVAIRNSTNALGFEQYNRFIEVVVCGEPTFQTGQLASKRNAHTLKKVKKRTALPFPNVERYRLLKAATEVFLMVRCGVDLDDFTGVDLEEESRRLNRTVEQGDLEDEMRQYLTLVAAGDGEFLDVLPYLGLIRLKLQDVPIVDSQDRDDAAQICFGILAEKLTNPCFLELIWSYWLEEGLLVRAMNAISWRFQNRTSGPPGRDPLANLDIDPLRPLNNLLWAYIQDEQHRLSMLRRAYEYDHQYGLVLASRPGPPVRGADSRSRFVEAFHNLLTLTWEFHRQDDDTTVIADGFGVLNALKETHLLLTEGAHNQFGDLPSTARQEMLMQQWILSRPEVREFLPTRTMVAYTEPWMAPVDAMSKLQGWSDTPVQHFRDLAVFGEQLLLGIRFGAWSAEFRPETAANWARYWRSELQGYIHAYRAVTGIDLVQRGASAIPGFHQRRRHGAYRG